MNIDQERQLAVGIDINANHVRPKRDGIVTATATPVHVGHAVSVWDIRITDERDDLICASRCTLAVIEQKGK